MSSAIGHDAHVLNEHHMREVARTCGFGLEMGHMGVWLTRPNEARTFRDMLEARRFLEGYRIAVSDMVDRELRCLKARILLQDAQKVCQDANCPELADDIGDWLERQA